MSGTSNRVFRLDEKYWCVINRLPRPMLGRIIRLTNTIGKNIGLEFDEYVGGHSCDGFGVDGRCLWVTPQWIYSESEWESLSRISHSSRAFLDEISSESLEELVIVDNKNC